MDGGTSLVGTGDHCKAKACAAMETEGQHQAEDSFTKSDRSVPVPNAGMRFVRGLRLHQQNESICEHFLRCTYIKKTVL